MQLIGDFGIEEEGGLRIKLGQDGGSEALYRKGTKKGSGNGPEGQHLGALWVSMNLRPEQGDNQAIRKSIKGGC